MTFRRSLKGHWLKGQGQPATATEIPPTR